MADLEALFFSLSNEMRDLVGKKWGSSAGLLGKKNGQMPAEER